MSLDLLGQASGWLPHAHYVSVAIPRVRYATAAREYLRWKGIGVFLISEPSTWVKDPADLVRDEIGPEIHRRCSSALRAAVRPEHKTFAPAGTSGGGGFTPYKATCAEVLRVAKASPGLTMREIVAQIRHHYQTPASAHGALVRWIEAGKVPGVEIRRDGKVGRIYPAHLTR